MSLCLAVLALVGCAGLDIRALTPQQAADLHAGNGPAGYVVYAPMTVVEISDRDGCRVGAPFQLPDPARPYLLRSRSGLGRNGVDVSVADGWMLGGFKDTSDNSAWLGTAGQLLGLRPGGEVVPRTGVCRAPGLYRLAVQAGGELELRALHAY
ncbi:MAG: hypothetical protein IT480_06970 [Gammaproteobacteria bacterium]|nr:hypothetical protein [Gammaproteobacteria bacterium]